MIKQWEKAVRKSVLISGACVFLMGVLLPHEYFGKILIAHWAYVLPFHFIISVLGWFFVGMPCHCIISRFTNGNALYYVSAALVVSAVPVLFFRDRLGVVLGAMTIIQCLIFVYYLKTQNYRNIQESTQ